MKRNSSFDTTKQIDAAIEQRAEVVEQMIAPAFDEDSTYSIGSAVRYNGKLWVCVRKIDTPDEWDPNDWQLATAQVQAIDSDEPQAQLVWQGYFYAGVFWKEDTHLNRLANRPDRLYIDLGSKEVYTYIASTESYVKLIQPASDTVAGIAKLYDATGNNIDGSMTQKSVSKELKKKVEIDASHLVTDERLDIKVE